MDKTTLTKICTKCGKEKFASPEYFYIEPKGKFGLRGDCIECRDTYKKQYRLSHKEETREYNKKYHKENRQQRLIYKTLYNQNNRVEIRIKAKERYWNNPELHREKSKISKKNNRAKATALEMKRQANKLSATPSWSETENIEQLYEAANYLTRLTEIQWDVDHEVPLQGRNVRGLHVYNNLQLLPHIDNVKKGNRYGSERCSG